MICIWMVEHKLLVVPPPTWFVTVGMYTKITLLPNLGAELMMMYRFSIFFSNISWWIPEDSYQDFSATTLFMILLKMWTLDLWQEPASKQEPTYQKLSIFANSIVDILLTFSFVIMLFLICIKSFAFGFDQVWSK